MNVFFQDSTVDFEVDDMDIDNQEDGIYVTVFGELWIGDLPFDFVKRISDSRFMSITNRSLRSVPAEKVQALLADYYTTELRKTLGRISYEKTDGIS